ncbi:MAG: phenylalanine 4-monooxygenase [Candidatus Cloacimonetes bacterium]|nr:phenylalanine 4-monooxygenase [Candidatus Cloacimonadota bacterium]
MNDEYLVPLDQDHPGFRDPEYIRQRDEIAQAALDWRKARDLGNHLPIPRIPYLEHQHKIWEHIYTTILELSSKNAVTPVFDGLKDLDLNPKKIPELEHVNQRLEPKTGFRVVPVTGLVKSRYFFSCLTRREFFCTQYIRHHSAPDFTPEPDICHDVIGHVPLLMSEPIANCYVEFAQAALRATPEEIKQLEQLYWFTIEYGLCYENEKIKTYGAGNLSSIADLIRCVNPDLVRHEPFSIEVMLNQTYDPTIQQPVLFLAPSLEYALKHLSDYLNQTFIQTNRPVLPLDD